MPLTAAEMGLDWELGVNYVQNIEITIELSQFQPLFVQSWRESWENSTLDVSSSLQNVNAGIFERSQTAMIASAPAVLAPIDLSHHHCFSDNGKVWVGLG